MSNVEQATYETKDLYFAAFLNLRLEMVGVRAGEEWNVKRRKTKQVKFFVFRSDSSIPELKSQYFSGRGEVSALAYADSIRNLKTLLHL